MRVTTADAFNNFKAKRLEFRLQYLRFAASDYMAKVTEGGLDDARLKAFWNENRVFRQEFQSPATVSAEVLSLNPKTYSLDEAKKLTGGREVTREQALAYFRKNQATLKAQVPPDKRHLLVITDDTKLEDIVSPFDLLEETIKKTLLLQQSIRVAHEKAKGGVQDLKSLSESYRLGYRNLDTLDRPKAMMALRDLGFAAFSSINEAPKAEVSEIKEEAGLIYFFRVNDRQASRLPEFDEIRQLVRERYIMSRGTDMARKEAQALISFMNTKVNEEVEAYRKERQTEANAEVDKRIAEQALTDNQRINRERQRAMGNVRREVEERKRSLYPKHFDAYIADKGLKTATTDYFEFQPYRPENFQDRSAAPVVPKEKDAFLRSNYYVKSLEVGQVTPILLEDPVSKAFFIAKLIDKRDPAIETMGPVDFNKSLTEVRQNEENQFSHRWRYPSIAGRLQLRVERN